MKKVIGVILLAGMLFCSSMGLSLQGETKVRTQEELKEVEKAGTYPVRVYLEEEAKEAIIYVTVTLPGTELNDLEGIQGEDFTVAVGEMKRLSANELIAKANVYAWRLSDGDNVPIENVEVTDGSAEEGYYNVRYQTTAGTQKRVKAIVEKNSFTNKKYVTESAKRSWSNNYFLMFSIFIIFLLVCPIFASILIYVLAQQQMRRLLNIILHKSQKKD